MHNVLVLRHTDPVERNRRPGLSKERKQCADGRATREEV